MAGWLDWIRQLLDRPDPGTQVLGPDDDLEEILKGQGNIDPLDRPVYSSHPLGLNKQQRVKLGRKEGKEFQERYLVEDRRNWLGQARSGSGMPEPSFDLPEQGENRWDQVVQNMNTLHRMQAKLDDDLKAGKITPQQAHQFQTQIDRFRAGANAQLDVFKSDMMKDVLKQIKVLSGKRQL